VIFNARLSPVYPPVMPSPGARVPWCMLYLGEGGLRHAVVLGLKPGVRKSEER
jgi:hypothetical protein